MEEMKVSPSITLVRSVALAVEPNQFHPGNRFLLLEDAVSGQSVQTKGSSSRLLLLSASTVTSPAEVFSALTSWVKSLTSLPFTSDVMKPLETGLVMHCLLSLL